MKKKKFINVVPLTNIARDRFVHTMNCFHACLILNEDDLFYDVVSLNGMYQFRIQKKGNDHWKLVNK